MAPRRLLRASDACRPRALRRTVAGRGAWRVGCAAQLPAGRDALCPELASLAVFFKLAIGDQGSPVVCVSGGDRCGGGTEHWAM